MVPDSQETVPYVDAVWQDGAERRVLLVVADDADRQELVEFLEVFGYQVSWASDAGTGAKLFARTTPDVVIADLETIAPDFEPLRPSLETLFGAFPPRPVVIVGTDDCREKVEWVKAAVPDPCIASGREQLLIALEALIVLQRNTPSGNIEVP